MIIADTHSHSNHSTDSTASMEDMIVWAIKNNLKIFTFTEHMDYDNHHYLVPSSASEGLKRGDFEVDTIFYFNEFNLLKEKWSDHIELLFGVEYGLQPNLSQELEDYSKAFPFDYIIGSSHEVLGVDPYYPEFIKNRTAMEAYHLYFKTEAECAKNCDDFDVYGHIDYGLRYHQDKIANFEFKYSDFSDELDDLIKTLIYKGKGLEFNTKSLSYFDINHSPSISVLKRYIELGGEIVTIGSDAHKPADIARDFDKAEEILKSLNIKSYAVYKNRVPIFYDL